MLISIHAFFSCLLLVSSARAQVSAPNCTDDTLAWTFNSLKQNPCLVSAYLAAVCDNGSFSISSLLPGHSYTGPSGIDDSDQCKCNTVVYNLVSACDACQGEPWNTYFEWTFNCTSKATPGTFPEPVPDGTRVPRWAYIDTSIGGSWNSSAAQLEGDSPEVTGTASNVLTASSTTEAFQTSSPSSSTFASHHSPNTGAIAGGIVGGVIGAALLAGFVLWFVLRRRRARSVPPASMVFQGGEKEHPTPPPLPEGALKLYDPSDPTTYPSKDYLSLSNQHLGSTIHTQPSDGAYRSLPEV